MTALADIYVVTCHELAKRRRLLTGDALADFFLQVVEARQRAYPDVPAFIPIPS